MTSSKPRDLESLRSRLAVWLQGSQVRAWGALVLVATLILVLRVAVGSKTELDAGDAAASRGDYAAATVHLRRAASWYLPGNPFCSSALRRLEAIGATARENGDFDLALLAFRSLRAAILSARSFYTPHPALLERSERQIAFLMAAHDPPPVDVGKGREQVEREHYALLKQRTRPKVGWGVLALAGAALWMVALFVMARGVEDQHGRTMWARLPPWAVVFVVGLIAFFLGLRFA